jgi:hypothetical protein
MGVPYRDGESTETATSKVLEFHGWERKESTRGGTVIHWHHPLHPGHMLEVYRSSGQWWHFETGSVADVEYGGPVAGIKNPEVEGWLADKTNDWSKGTKAGAIRWITGARPHELLHAYLTSRFGTRSS